MSNIDFRWKSGSKSYVVTSDTVHITMKPCYRDYHKTMTEPVTQVLDVDLSKYVNFKD